MKDTEQAAIATLEGAPSIFRALLGGLPDEIVSADLDRGWSAKRILAHMVDVDVDAFSGRLRMIVEQDNPTLATIDPMARMDAMGWEKTPTDALLTSLEDARRPAITWLRGLTDEQLQRTGEHATTGEMTASNLLHYWAYHDLAHLRGVQRMIQGVLGHELGNAGSESMDV